MYDNDPLLDARLAADTGFYSSVGLPFIPARKGTENEIKFLTKRPYTDFPKILDGLEDRGNRNIDNRTLSAKQKALITLNIDTVDPTTGLPTQIIRKNGFSARVRFEMDPSDLAAPVTQIDFSVKTRSSTGNVVYLIDERGEWEAPLTSLQPSLQALCDNNSFSAKNGRRTLPLLFKSDALSDNMFRVESIGLCWRTTFISTHTKLDEPYDVAALYDHTEDFNLFTTPHADIINVEDYEAEAEFKGLIGAEDIDDDTFDRIQTWSIERTDKLINSLSRTLTRNNVSKASRAELALENAYGFICEKGVAEYFGEIARSPSAYALSQNVKPEEVRLDNIVGHLMRLQNDRDRNLGIIIPTPGKVAGIQHSMPA